MAVSGYFYMQKHPMEGKTSADKTLNISGNRISKWTA